MGNNIQTLNNPLFLQTDVDGQPLHPYIDSRMGSRSLPNSSSEICLRSQEEHMETRSNIRKHSSMTRLSRDSLDGDGVIFYGSPRRIVDSCVQTDDEDREERCVCVGGWRWYRWRWVCGLSNRTQTCLMIKFICQRFIIQLHKLRVHVLVSHLIWANMITHYKKFSCMSVLLSCFFYTPCFVTG